MKCRIGAANDQQQSGTDYRAKIYSLSARPPLDPVLISLVEALAVADFWADHAAAQGAGAASDVAGSELSQVLDRAPDREVYRGPDRALPRPSCKERPSNRR